MSFKTLLLFFLHFDKILSEKCLYVSDDHILFLFPYVSSDLCFMHLCFFVVKVSNGL